MLMNTDFESLDGWLGGTNTPSLSREKAHSGKVALRVGPGVEYSMGYSTLLGKLSQSKLKKIKISAWGLLPEGKDKANPKLVLELKDPATGKGLLWEDINFAQKAKRGKWEEVEKVITIPDAATYTSQLVLYAWSPGSSEQSYVDDIQITAVP